MRPRWILMLALIALPGSARAQGFDAHLSWTNCMPKEGTLSYDFACGTLDLSEQLIVTFTVGTPLTQLVAIEGAFELATTPACFGLPDEPVDCTGPLVPSWWQMQTGGCRQNSIGFSMDFTRPPFSSGSGCANPWSGQWAGAMIWDYPSVYRGLPSTADARFVGAVPQNTPASVTPGVEYYAGWFRIGNALTTGDHACEGCCTPVYLSLRFLRLDQPAGVGDLYIFPHTPTLAWQGAGGLCGPTPAQRRTWGQLKSLYR